MAASDGTAEPAEFTISTPDFDTEIRAADGWTVLTVGGEVDLATVGRFREGLHEAQGSPRVLVDLSELTFIDSSGINALVAAYHRIPTHGELRVVGLRPNIRKVFEITGLISLFGTDTPDDPVPTSIDS